MVSNLHKERVKACREAIFQAITKEPGKSFVNEDLRCAARKFLRDIMLIEVIRNAQVLAKEGLIGRVRVAGGYGSRGGYHNAYQALPTFSLHDPEEPTALRFEDYVAVAGDKP